MTSIYPIFKKCREIVCFNFITYFCKVSHNSIKKITNSTIQIFFLLIYIFCVALTSRKTQIKMGDYCFHFITKRQQRDNFIFKWSFCARGMGGVSRQSLFSQLESSKSLLKALGLQKGPYLPLLRPPVKIKLNSNLCRLKLMLTSSVVSDTDYH